MCAAVHVFLVFSESCVFGVFLVFIVSSLCPLCSLCLVSCVSRVLCVPSVCL